MGGIGSQSLMILVLERCLPVTFSTGEGNDINFKVSAESSNEL